MTTLLNTAAENRVDLEFALGSSDFVLPAELEASEPPEARGLARDQVRLLVTAGAGKAEHAVFRQLPDFLQAGDLLVINTSATLPAALTGQREDGSAVEVHLSTRLPAGMWSAELRQPAVRASRAFYGGRAGEVIGLPGGGQLKLYAPYSEDRRIHKGDRVRLWVARLAAPLSWADYLHAHGFPIRYEYMEQSWPLAYYQTAFAVEPGSAEMPSAGRPFTPELITRLVANGVQIAPLVLHTGVASLEEGEPPYAEYYRVPEPTAQQINHVRATGGRVVAVGTTVVRAVESVVDDRGRIRGGEGWTRLVIGEEHRPRAIDGLLTGFHEPRASHLQMLQALAGNEHLGRAYEEALTAGYLWHEFGDIHLILP